MSGSRFAYVIYVRAAPQALWDALVKPEFQKQYWFGLYQDSGWTEGSDWSMKHADGQVANAGKILESRPPQRLVIRWRHEARPELRAEGFSRCTYEIAADGEICRLGVVHEIAAPNSKFIELAAAGWPKALSSLKSFLETGAPLPRPPDAPAGAEG